MTGRAFFSAISGLRNQQVKLDVIAKVMTRHPDATARIEGHADRSGKSSESYNQKLSQRRAQAVLNYLSDVGGIRRGNMEAVGYGFSRPKAANDPQTGNPENRRVEVYIRGSGGGPVADVGTGIVLPPDSQ